MAWEITGNSGTNPNVNFLGTKDDQPLVIKTGGVEAMRIYPGGHIDIGGGSNSSMSIRHTNFADIGLAYATLRIENPHGYQSIQSFSFANDEKASIRADSNGNLVLNAKSSKYWLSRDFGDTDAITIVPHDIGRTLAIAGNLKASSGLFGSNVAVIADSGVIGDGTVGVYGHCPSGGAYGVWGVSDAGTTGVLGNSSNVGVGGFVSAPADSGGVAVSGWGGSTTSNTGVYGETGSGAALHAYSRSGISLLAESETGVGLKVSGGTGNICASFDYGNVYVYNGDLNLGNDLNVSGRTNINNALYAASFFSPLKFFKIDHPKDPANKYLYHASVESSDYKNIYDGVTVLNDNGEATIDLPEWFGELNCDYRYQLTCIGQYNSVYIAEEITNNRFKIAGGSAGGKVCWQVTGIRHDAVVKANPMVVEEDKPIHERGYYLSSEAHGQQEESGIEWKRNAERKQQLEKLQHSRAIVSKRPVFPTLPSSQKPQ